MNDFKCNYIEKDGTYGFFCGGSLKNLSKEEKKEFYQSLNNLIEFAKSKHKERIEND